VFARSPRKHLLKAARLMMMSVQSLWSIEREENCRRRFSQYILQAHDLFEAEEFASLSRHR
jgi:hypothetical protein